MNAYTIVIECPNTGKATTTGHEVADIHDFKFIGLAPETVRCEHCNESHVWRQQDAWPVGRPNASRVRLAAASTGKPTP